MSINKYQVSNDHKYDSEWIITPTGITGSVEVLITDTTTNPADKIGTSVSVGFEAARKSDGSFGLTSNTILWAGDVIPYENFIEIKDFCWETQDISQIMAQINGFVNQKIANSPAL